MKKVVAILILCLVQCTGILAVIQPPANAGLQSNSAVCFHNLCSCKQVAKSAGSSIEQVGSIGILEPTSRLNN